MCRVNSCCCGCSLTTGAIVVCVFTGIAALSNLISGASTLSLVKEYQNNQLPSPEVSNTDKETFFEVLNGYGCFQLFSGAISGLAFLGLLLGITMRRAGFVMVWLVVDMIYIVCGGTLAILIFVSLTWYLAGGIAFGIVYLAVSSLSIYFWIVVLSYYHDLNEGGDGQGQQVAGYPKGAV